MSKKRAAFQVQKKPYKTEFLHEVLVAIFGGLKSVSKDEAILNLENFIRNKKTFKGEGGNVFDYLLKRKFFRLLPEGRIAIIQRKLQSLKEHMKCFVKPKPVKILFPEVKSYKEQKKKARSLAAKVAFDESVAIILGAIFGENLKAQHSLGLVETWTFELMSAEWHCHKGCVNYSGKQPTRRQAVKFVEKMIRFGLIEMIDFGKLVFTCLTQKGSIYCGLAENDAGPERLSKSEKFSNVLANMPEDSVLPGNIKGLRALKKHIGRVEAFC
jgi:hypothetical protein